MQLLLVLSLVALACAAPFANPTELKSVNGVLNVVLAPALTRHSIEGFPNILTRVYNGSFTPPTLRVKPGDTINLALVNSFEKPTNLHFHGMTVTPTSPGDDSNIQVDPATTFKYKIDVPKDHAKGLFWYHAHFPGDTEFQLMNGLGGLLVVEGVLDAFPSLAGIKEYFFLLKDIQIDANKTVSDIDSALPTNRFVNGQANPTLTIAPGETQLWRVGNVGADIYYHISVNNLTIYELAHDGRIRKSLQAVQDVLLPPSSRTEFLVVGPTAGTYTVKTLAFDTGADPYPETTLATLVSTGTPVTPIPLTFAFPEVVDLRTATIANKRKFLFHQTEDEQFFISGKQFDMGRIDTTVYLGDIEEWTIENNSTETHVFHIHQVEFQVVEINGQPFPFVGRQDVINIPPAANPDVDNSKVKIIIPFTHPSILGTFMYHCHILKHEDNGMMAQINVVERPPANSDKGKPSNSSALFPLVVLFAALLLALL